MTSSTLIDLSKMPLPDAILPLDFEAIYSEMLAEILKLYPSFDPVTSDFGVKILETAAFFRLKDREAYNIAIKQCYIATATGSNLDNAAARNLTQRLLNETDSELRARAVLAPSAFSTAGPTDAYIYYGKSAHPDILDIRAYTPNPAIVNVAILPKPDANITEIIEVVTNALSAKSVRPLGIQVVIEEAIIVDFTIDATLFVYSGPDSAVVLAEAQKGLNEYLSSVNKIGHDITLSGIMAALFVAGVQKVVLNNLSQDILIAENEAGNCTSITLNLGGVGE